MASNPITNIHPPSSLPSPSVFKLSSSPLRETKPRWERDVGNLWSTFKFHISTLTFLHSIAKFSRPTLKFAGVDQDNTTKNRDSSKIRQAGIIVASSILVIGLMSYVWKKKLSFKGITRKDYNNEGGNADMELPIFDMIVIANATCNFSSNKKLGEGGFGPLYKG
ncbi:putative lrr receptor-like serine/threonine-protein kinase [Quercus suber]|uniref:Lrr receptor-like serine/threonine-protein kinase n=1 Tax=Quercus suber TaxID=58331 RepID=A0AAW0K5A7_QUESU